MSNRFEGWPCGCEYLNDEHINKCAAHADECWQCAQGSAHPRCDRNLRSQTPAVKASYLCNNGVAHPRAEWCRTHLTDDEAKTFSAILIRLGSCCIPHSEAWCSGGECPSCAVRQFVGLDDPDGTCPADWVMNKADVAAVRKALTKDDPRL